MLTITIMIITVTMTIRNNKDNNNCNNENFERILMAMSDKCSAWEYSREERN